MNDRPTIMLLVLFLVLGSVDAKTLLLTTGIDDSSHLLSVLPESVVVIEADDYSHVDLSKFDQVIVAFDSADLDSKDANFLKTYALEGGNLILFGGSTSESFTSTLSDVVLLQHPQWRTPGNTLTIFDHGCPLVDSMSPRSSIGNESLPTFALPVSSNSRVCFRDAYGVPVVLTQSFHRGVVSFIGLSPRAEWYVDDDSIAFLGRLLTNAIRTTQTEARKPRKDNLLLFSMVNELLPSSLLFESLFNDYYHTHSSYDVVYTSSFSSVALEEYKHVVLYVYAEEKLFNEDSWKSLFNAVDKGIKLSLFGGSLDMSKFLNMTALIRAKNDSFKWRSSSQILNNVKPKHPLARKLPNIIEFNEVDLTKYSVEVTDAKFTTVFRNTKGWPALGAKQLGKGFVTFSSFKITKKLSFSDRKTLSQIVKNCFALTYDEAKFVPSEILVIRASTLNSFEVFNSTEEMLKNGGFNYDLVNSVQFQLVDVAPYSTVIILNHNSALKPYQFQVVRHWVSSGMRVVWYGSKDEYKFLIQQGLSWNLISTRSIYHETPTQTVIDAKITDSSDPLVRNLAPAFKFADSCWVNHLGIDDLDARISIRRSNGLGDAIAASKTIGKGVFVIVDVDISCYAGDDRGYFQQLLFNSLSISPRDTHWKRKQVLLSLISDDYNFDNLHFILNNIGVEYDFIRTNSVASITSLEYNTYIIAFNGMDFADYSVDALQSLLVNNKRVFILGGSLRLKSRELFSKNFIRLNDFDALWPFRSNGVQNFDQGKFNNNLPPNTTFSQHVYHPFVPTGEDVVVYQRSQNGYPCLMCKSNSQWGDSVLALSTLVPVDSNDNVFQSYLSQVITNFLSLESYDCVRERRQHLVHLVVDNDGTFPNALEPAITAVQHALGGLPFHLGGVPLFDLIISNYVTEYVVDYNTIFLNFVDSSLPHQYFRNLNNTLVFNSTKILLTGGDVSSHFVLHLDQYLMKADFLYKWVTSAQPTYKLGNPHYLTRAFPRRHKGDVSSRQYAVQVNDAKVNVLAVNGDKVPFLVEKKYGQSRLIYCPIRFAHWEKVDLLLQEMIIHNFYHYV
ncbi:hypothetical protein P9112_012833 [Eukaryota sp. TZLM1-RC]